MKHTEQLLHQHEEGIFQQAHYLLEGRYSIKWLRGPFRWSQFYNNNKPDLPPAHGATTQAVGVLIPVCFLCITTLGRQNFYFFLVPAKQHHKSHADHRKSLISA